MMKAADLGRIVSLQINSRVAPSRCLFLQGAHYRQIAETTEANEAEYGEAVAFEPAAHEEAFAREVSGAVKVVVLEQVVVLLKYIMHLFNLLFEILVQNAAHFQ